MKTKTKSKRKRGSVAAGTKRFREANKAEQTSRRPAKAKKKSKRKYKNKGDKKKLRVIAFTIPTFDTLKRSPGPLGDNCVALYIFYLRTCAYQRNPSIWCTNNFAAKGLNWGMDKLQRAKRQLTKLGYIKTVRTFDEETGKFGKSFIKVKYSLKEKTIENSEHSRILDELTEEFVEWCDTFTTERCKWEIENKRLSDKVAVLEQQVSGNTKTIPTANTPKVKQSPVKDKKVRTKKKQKNTFDYKCAKKLAKTIQEKKNDQRYIDIEKWTAQFKKFRVKGKFEKSRIKQVLIWYCKHLEDRFVPKAYSANTFCERFSKIEDARERLIKDVKDGKPRTVRRKKVGSKIIYGDDPQPYEDGDDPQPYEDNDHRSPAEIRRHPIEDDGIY